MDDDKLLGLKIRLRHGSGGHLRRDPDPDHELSGTCKNRFLRDVVAFRR
ncbi:hypothetical protein PI125_g12817 [Phytophthora idaei]|nr:hypothetical protein PI125_g12817 [Phytophthora idaei]